MVKTFYHMQVTQMEQPFIEICNDFFLQNILVTFEKISGLQNIDCITLWYHAYFTSVAESHPFQRLSSSSSQQTHVTKMEDIL